MKWPLLIPLLLCGCATHPMFVGPPRSLPAAGPQVSVGASWTKPVDSSNVGIPQLDGALHLPVGESFDLAVRAWSLGAGMQGRFGLLARGRGDGIDLMLAPLVGVSTLVDYKEEGDERLLPPIEAEFLVKAPLVAGFGLGSCALFAGADPLLHIRPELFVMRVAALAGFACPTSGTAQIAPELAFELPLVGPRPEEGFQPGERRPPWMASVVRFGVAFSF